MTRRLGPGLLSLLILAGCGADPPPAEPATPGATARAEDRTSPSPPLLEEVPTTVGLDFVGFNGGTGRFYTAEINCGGGALLDADGDGDLDVYLVQGALLEPGATLEDALFPPHPAGPPTDRLYANEPGDPWRFRDVTATAGLEGTTRFGCGAATADVDRDGDADLYLANFVGADQFLANRGDGTFEDASARVGVDNPRAAVAASFFDYDHDGWLDVFVVNNMRFDYENPIACTDLVGRPDYCGPGTYPFEEDLLLRNRGDGTFEDVTARAGLGGVQGPGLGVVTADLDGDGWEDVYVANDGQANFLWRNRGDGTFEETGLLSGAALNAAGEAEAGMGIAIGDPDRDGDPDLLVTHLVKETNTLYRNEGGGLFSDASTASGLAGPSRPYTSFGTVFVDVDLDGWDDLVVANGAVNQMPALLDRGDPYPLHQPNQLFLNRGGLRFEDVSPRVGPGWERSEVSRGILDGDLDDDGDRDLIVVNNNGPVRLFRNPASDRRGWLGIRALEARDPDLLAHGAEIALLDGDDDPVQFRWARTDGSYASARDPRALFGLGEDPGGPRTVRIRFRDGSVETWSDLEPGRYHTLVRGEGTSVSSE